MPENQLSQEKDTNILPTSIAKIFLLAHVENISLKIEKMCRSLKFQDSGNCQVKLAIIAQWWQVLSKCYQNYGEKIDNVYAFFEFGAVQK